MAYPTREQIEHEARRLCKIEGKDWEALPEGFRELYRHLAENALITKTKTPPRK